MHLWSICLFGNLIIHLSFSVRISPAFLQHFQKPPYGYEILNDLFNNVSDNFQNAAAASSQGSHRQVRAYGI